MARRKKPADLSDPEREAEQLDRALKVDPVMSAQARKNQGGWRQQARESFRNSGREPREDRQP